MIKRGKPSLDLRIKLYETGGHSAWNNGPESTVLNYKGEPILLSESKCMAIDFLKCTINL